MSFSITCRGFGVLASSEEVEAWTLMAPSGMVAEVLTYGCLLRALKVPDRGEDVEDVVLGYDSLEAYAADSSYLGATVGRVAGRVPRATVVIDGMTYILPANDGANHLHGGVKGFNKHLWTARPLVNEAFAELQMTRISPDGEEGYPGNLSVTVTFILSRDALAIHSEAETDAATPLSMTHHSYFNLAGESTGSAVEHKLQIYASEVITAQDDMTLTGNCVPVGPGNDLRSSRRLVDALASMHNGHGDLYRLAAACGGAIRLVARLSDPVSGRLLEVWTDEAYLQLYTGAHLDGSSVGKGGRSYGPRAGICLECEGYPDGANRPDLGSILLRPGETQRRCTVYRFSHMSLEEHA